MSTIEERLAALEQLLAGKLPVKNMPVTQLQAALEDHWSAAPPQFTTAPRATSLTATSTAGEGPSTSGADLVYQSLKLALTRGVWLVMAQATMVTSSSSSTGDAKQLGLWNFTANAAVPSSKGPVVDSATGSSAGFQTIAVVEVNVDKLDIGMVGYRNGTSTVSIGYAGSLNEEQRITALKIA